MTEAKYSRNISPILCDNWVDNVPSYHSYYNFHMKRKAAKKRLARERGVFCVVSIMLVMLCMMMFSITPKSQETYENNLRHSVSYGDTLWSIANEYKPCDVSTGEFVYEIKEINNMTTSNINVGDLLIIPE